MVSSAVLLLATFLVLAQDVFVPPVPRGVARDGRIRRVDEPIPFPREDQNWIRVRTNRFDVLSAANEERTRAIAADLESLAAALTESSPRFEEARVPATIFVFATRREIQPYLDLLTGIEGTRVNGLYVRHGGGGAMFIDGSHRGFERTATHELVHDLLRQGDVAPPLWLEEGLAEFVANAQITKKGVVAGAPIAGHARLLASAPQKSVDAMLGVKIESSEATSSYFYAQSWAAVHWLMQTDAAAFWPFLRDVERGTSVADALRVHYGKSLDELHRAIYARSRGRKPIQLGPRVPEIKTAALPLDRPTLLYELATFLGHVGGAENEGTRHLREALRLNPNHARTLAALDQYDAAIAADPNDPRIHLEYAEFLLKPAIGDFAGVFEPTDPVRFTKARELATRALALHADEARTRGVLGISHLADNDLASGIRELERARQLAPWRMDYAIHLYSMYLRSGARDKADALFAAAFENARDKQVAFAARNVLLEAETERANKLAAAGKLDEAAKIVRDMAATIPDPKGREDLEREAAKIEGVALVNRHITIYNSAVTLSNAGKTKDALRLLDELLAVATDAQVIRDADKLKRELSRRK